jgi:uncharacterized protein YkwD
MLRTLAVSLAMLAALPGACPAQTTSPVIDAPNNTHYDVSSKQPAPDNQPSPILHSADGPSAGEDSAAENELLAAVNKSRKQTGAPPLRMDESLREAARAHARLMIASERLDHQFSGEPALLDRIAQAGPLKLDRAGENVAYSTCASGANDALMHSAPHRENLLNRAFNVAGVAAVWNKDKLYVVQDFAHELPSYSAKQSGHLVGQAVDEMRQQAGLPELVQLAPPNLDEATCSLARESSPNAHLLATAYDNRRIITYTQSRPDVLPQAALSMLRDPGVRQFAVGSCYARNTAHPTGTYWVAILLY